MYELFLKKVADLTTAEIDAIRHAISGMATPDPQTPLRDVFGFVEPEPEPVPEPESDPSK